MVWNYPWGSWGNWKAGQGGDKREDLIVVPPGELGIILHPRAPHLYLSLFPRVFDGLEDVPGASPSHLWASDVLTVPSLNQDGRSQSCHTIWPIDINHLNPLLKKLELFNIINDNNVLLHLMNQSWFCPLLQLIDSKKDLEVDLSILLYFKLHLNLRQNFVLFHFFFGWSRFTFNFEQQKEDRHAYLWQLRTAEAKEWKDRTEAI